MKGLGQMMVFMPLVIVLIGQFCLDMIGHQDLKVATGHCLVFVSTASKL